VSQRLEMDNKSLQGRIAELEATIEQLQRQIKSQRDSLDAPAST
jgi:peptidoglycan hydrolase CwlO-like protein